MSNLMLERVDAGETLLDENYGTDGWRHKIDLNTLDLSDVYQCVLGQLFDSYTSGLYTFGHGFDTEWAVEHGFSATGEYNYGYDELTAEWKHRIANN